MALSVALGVVACVAALGKWLGWWTLAGWVPLAFAAAGVAGTFVLAWLALALLRRFRAA